MERPFRHTEYRKLPLTLGAVLVLAGGVLLALGVTRLEAWATVAPSLVEFVFGWGTFLQALQAGLMSLALATGMAPARSVFPAGSELVLIGSGVWLLGWVGVALGIRSTARDDRPPSEAVGAKLYPPLARYRDFYWSTLGAYGGGILGAELAVLVLQIVLAGGVPVTGTAAEDTGPLSLPPTGAFAVALMVGFAIAFAAGFVGAARARRLSVPEATIALIYLGLPIPILLTLMGFIPELQLTLGYRLREVVYVASLIGRPEMSYWLTFAGLVLMMVLGITSGFVATGSGRVDLRLGTELFIARRHVSVFRPKLLLGTLAVLLFGIIPPLIVYAVIKAVENAVERTRIRALGLKDPLRASEALNAWRMSEQTPTAMMTALSVGGVGVGVMALIIVLSVMSGFELDLQKKILGTNAHAVVQKYVDDFEEFPEVMQKVRKVQGVTGVTPFIMNEVMISSDQNIAGTIIKGIDPATVGTVTDLPENIQPGGELRFLDHPEELVKPRTGSRRLAPEGGPALDEGAPEAGDKTDILEDDIIRAPSAPPKELGLPGIIVGKELAASLKVVVGDRVNVVSPLGGDLGPQGPMPKSRPFRVAGIFYSGMYEYDSKFVYIRLQEAQQFFNVKGVTGIELKVQDIDDARRISKSVLNALGNYPYRVRDWGEMNKNLFSALRLEKLVMAIILSIIVIVAAGLIVATVIMLVLEKRKEIAVLKALGVSDGGIVKIFLAEGLQIGVAGGVLGLIAGLAWCLFIERVGIKLDPEVYYIPSLPVKIEPLQTAVPVVIAVLVTYLASIYPALKASRVEPVEGLKAE